MENAETYLRRMAAKSQEFVTTQVNATAVAAQFTSQLALGFGRTGLFVFNRSISASGECYYGPVGVTPSTGMPLLKDALVEILITDALDLYFIADAGENGDLRVLELS